MHSTTLDHPYCVKAPKMNISNAMTKTESETNSVEQSPVKSPDTTPKTATSPRKSARISLRRDPEGESKAESEGASSSVGFVGAVHPGIVQPGFVGAVHPGIVQPEHAGVGRGRGRGRKSLIPEETPVNIRFVLSEFEVISLQLACLKLVILTCMNMYMCILNCIYCNMCNALNTVHVYSYPLRL